MKPTRLELSLLLMRLSVFYVMFVWALDKILNPDHAAAVFSKFYMFDGLGLEMAYAIGGIQIAIYLAFVVGMFKRVTYGVVLIMHGISTLSTWEYLVDPYVDEPKAMLFMAAVPMLAACLTLYLMRASDRFLYLI
jgi:putative oxidoreductase